MSYSEFDSFDNKIEKMLNTEKRRYNSPFSYFDEIDANKVDMWTGQEDKTPVQAFRGSAANKIQPTGWVPDDRVNSPSHYTSGRMEAIDIIEDAIQDAPSAKEGMLQGQVLKYLLRVWLKDNPVEDLKKAEWYLTRLISKLEGEQ